MKGLSTTRKALLAAGAAVTLVASVAACSNGPTTEETVTITFTWWGDDNRAELTRQQIELFQQKHPNIKVTGLPQSFDRYFDQLADEFAEGKAPDVIAMGDPFPKQHGREGNLLDLGSAEGLDISTFSAGVLEAATHEGVHYGVPTGGNTVAVFANPAIFKKAGVALPNDDTWSWTDFAVIAVQISAALADEGIYGAEIRSYDLIGAYAGQSTPLYDSDGNITVTAETLTRFWSSLQTLVANGGLPPADLMQQVSSAEPALTLFGQGRSAMFVGYGNRLGAYAEAAGVPAGTEDSLLMLRIPGEAQAAHPGTTLLPSHYYTINAHTEHPKEAAMFVDFLVNDPESAAIIKTNRGMPANPQVAAALADSLTGYDKVFAEYMGRVAAHFGPSSFLPPAWSQEINRITQNVESKVIFNQITPAEAAADWLAQVATAKAAAG